MRRFSESQGIINPRTVFQRGTIDDRLKNRLWSAVDQIFWRHLDTYYHETPLSRFLITTTQDTFFGLATDELHSLSVRNVANFKAIIFRSSWNVFYDFIQFLADFSLDDRKGDPYQSGRMIAAMFVSQVNIILAAEKSAYRFVASELCEITDKNEIAEIERAVSSTDKFDSAKIHLSAALRLYASRENPDYRNSIKESISAIESSLSVINGEKSRNMASALSKAEEKGLVLHPAMKDGISKLYGWASDDAGIRHSLFDGDGVVDEAHARFLLVICSALFNFLRTVNLK